MSKTFECSLCSATFTKRPSISSMFVVLDLDPIGRVRERQNCHDIRGWWRVVTCQDCHDGKWIGNRIGTAHGC